MGRDALLMHWSWPVASAIESQIAGSMLTRIKIVDNECPRHVQPQIVPAAMELKHRHLISHSEPT